MNGPRATIKKSAGGGGGGLFENAIPYTPLPPGALNLCSLPPREREEEKKGRRSARVRLPSGFGDRTTRFYYTISPGSVD